MGMGVGIWILALSLLSGSLLAQEGQESSKEVPQRKALHREERRKRWEGYSREEKLKLLESYRRWESLPEKEKERLQKKHHNLEIFKRKALNSLPEEEQRSLKKLPFGQRQRKLNAIIKDFEQKVLEERLPPERHESLRGLPPEARGKRLREMEREIREKRMEEFFRQRMQEGWLPREEGERILQLPFEERGEAFFQMQSRFFLERDRRFLERLVKEGRLSPEETEQITSLPPFERKEKMREIRKESILRGERSFLEILPPNSRKWIENLSPETFYREWRLLKQAFGPSRNMRIRKAMDLTAEEEERLARFRPGGDRERERKRLFQAKKYQFLRKNLGITRHQWESLERMDPQEQYRTIRNFLLKISSEKKNSGAGKPGK